MYYAVNREGISPIVTNKNMKTKKDVPAWKINGLKRIQSYYEFESFDIYPSNRKAGIYCAALLRGGLIEVTGSTYWRNNKYSITPKGCEFIKNNTP